MSAKQPRTPEQKAARNDGAAKDRIAGGGESAAAEQHVSESRLPEPRRDLRRSATDMAPGIPTGSGQGIDEALDQPDSEIGGGVAGDTTVGLDAGEERDPNTVRDEDKGRTTL